MMVFSNLSRYRRISDRAADRFSFEGVEHGRLEAEA